MSNSKKAHELIRQNEQTVKKSQKHDANLQKNSTLYFQIGLIVCLLGVYGLLEMKFETTIPSDVGFRMPIDEPIEISINDFEVYKEPKAEVKPKVQKKVPLTIDPIIVDDNKLIKDLGIETTDPDITPTDPPIDPEAVNPEEKPTGPDNVPFILIQDAPIYPGCEKAKDNEERKKCMSQKITKLIQRKFDGSIASDYGFSGKQKIQVQFTIDKTGHVTDIKTRAPHPKLDKEAERVIKKIPEMTPGKQRDKNVGVIYTLPIVFDVQ